MCSWRYHFGLAKFATHRVNVFIEMVFKPSSVMAVNAWPSFLCAAFAVAAARWWLRFESCEE